MHEPLTGTTCQHCASAACPTPPTTAPRLLRMLCDQYSFQVWCLFSSFSETAFHLTHISRFPEEKEKTKQWLLFINFTKLSLDREQNLTEISTFQKLCVNFTLFSLCCFSPLLPSFFIMSELSSPLFLLIFQSALYLSNVAPLKTYKWPKEGKQRKPTTMCLPFALLIYFFNCLLHPFLLSVFRSQYYLLHIAHCTEVWFILLFTVVINKMHNISCGWVLFWWGENCTGLL